MNDNDESAQRLDVSVGSYISKLQSAFLGDSPDARATLAQLRQAVDEEPGQNPRAWERVMEVLPENYIGHGDDPNDGEWATHLALTFYAVHQQGNAKPMHVQKVSLGSAAGTLMRGRQPSTKSRYDAVLLASTLRQQRYHLRSLIGLFKADAIGLDYGRFANDLFLLQKDKYRSRIIRSWGRDFHRAFSRTRHDEAELEASSVNS
ncbi:type I-E CRISPR-associated protein Cse2/CasB [Bowdeniella nasicola]|uniref:Type I-E CRISPR-associated protein Cse2/CasB n=1 Tax=Bowdeniella nasicola TaxID=208480 RepID=A0A1Q5PZL4_9ACTO|nr:type I-E CRISPR-associated protein Cse2/CasB [Bowdeniella nasicola]OKL52916.1 type I-E CRISPR-associated protein Cse2/CasB [Bowdeniella nasicola]